MEGTFTRKFVLLLFLLSLVFQACDPVPGRQLNSNEKLADMLWLYSIMDQNYAPKEYKQEKHNFKYEEIKKQYLERALATQNNQQFYDTVFEFVSQFKDAHTSASLTVSSLPGRVQVAYLGFSGKRKGKNFLVSGLLPTSTGANFPIKEGDIITHVNGVPIAEYTLKEMTKFRDLGSDDANLTFNINRVFNRLSIQSGLPKEDEIILTIADGVSSKEVRLPWIVKDLYDFSIEQKNAASKGLGAGEEGDDATIEIREKSNLSNSFTMRFFDFEGNVISLDTAQIQDQIKSGSRFLDSFRMPSSFSHWAIDAGVVPKQEKSAFASLQLERRVPPNAIPIPIAKTFAAYMVPRDNLGHKEMQGYIRIGTFSPGGKEDEIIAQLEATLASFKDYGVNNVVIDLLNNGGGSLSLVYRVAQAFSAKALRSQGIRFGLNEGWLDSIERGKLAGESDAEKELMRRLHEKLLKEKDQGKVISSSYPIESIMPFRLKPNKSVASPFNTVLLVNEMCASAADIFSSLMKENQLATLMGSKTMGAGGNVVQYFQSPNAHFTINQTESLLVTAEGQYLENNGVEPDVKLDVSENIDKKYENVITAAFDLALKKKRAEFLASIKLVQDSSKAKNSECVSMLKKAQ